MSILILVNDAGSEKEESQLAKLLSSLEEISKKHKLNYKKILSKNIPSYLCPTLCCTPVNKELMSLLIFGAITALGEFRLDVASIYYS